MGRARLPLDPLDLLLEVGFEGISRHGGILCGVRQWLKGVLLSVVLGGAWVLAALLPAGRWVRSARAGRGCRWQVVLQCVAVLVGGARPWLRVVQAFGVWFEWVLGDGG